MIRANPDKAEDIDLQTGEVKVMMHRHIPQHVADPVEPDKLARRNSLAIIRAREKLEARG